MSLTGVRQAWQRDGLAHTPHEPTPHGAKS
jgi:hypothetical protein